MDEASGAVAGDCGRAAVSAASPSDEPPSECGAATAGPDRPLDDVDSRVGGALRVGWTWVCAGLNDELAVGAGVAMHEYGIHGRLSEAAGRRLRVSTLAGRVADAGSRLTHTVRRLEKAGYVERASCAVDKRGVNCRLTEEGLSFLRTAAPIHLDGVRRHVVDRFTHEQLIALTGLLTVLVGGGTD